VYITTRALTEANEATAGLLEQLGLEAYLFEVEPREGPWEVHVDCAVGDGWQSLTLPVDMARLLDTRSNEALRSQVLNDWRERLAACRYPTSTFD
jgi:hypothetical protein